MSRNQKTKIGLRQRSFLLLTREIQCIGASSLCFFMTGGLNILTCVYLIVLLCLLFLSFKLLLSSKCGSITDRSDSHNLIINFFLLPYLKLILKIYSLEGNKRVFYTWRCFNNVYKILLIEAHFGKSDKRNKAKGNKDLLRQALKESNCSECSWRMLCLYSFKKNEKMSLLFLILMIIIKSSG